MNTYVLFLDFNIYAENLNSIFIKNVYLIQPDPDHRINLSPEELDANKAIHCFFTSDKSFNLTREMVINTFVAGIVQKFDSKHIDSYIHTDL